MELFSEVFIMPGMINPGIDYGARIRTDRENDLFVWFRTKRAWTLLGFARETKLTVDRWMDR